MVEKILIILILKMVIILDEFDFMGHVDFEVKETIVKYNNQEKYDVCISTSPRHYS